MISAAGGPAAALSGGGERKSSGVLCAFLWVPGIVLMLSSLLQWSVEKG